MSAVSIYGSTLLILEIVMAHSDLAASAHLGKNGRQSRAETEGDWAALQMFSPADLNLAPEEYAARNAHRFGCFGLHHHRYVDPGIGAWVMRLGEILDSPEELERCRQKYLTAEEMAEVTKQEQEGF